VIGLIWAQAQDGVIGLDNAIPWHIPEDMKHFREVTAGSAVLMGRRNLVLSRTPQDGAETFESLEQALAAVTGDLWVMGGSAVYAATLPFADRVEVTEIRESFEGDTYAPKIDREPVDVGEWQESRSGLHFRFVSY